MLTLIVMNMVSSAKRFVQVSGMVGISLMYAMNNSDDRHDPCGTPSDGVLGSEKEMPTWTEYGLLKRKDCTRLTRDSEV
jgi:hypothetical protein